MAGVQLQGAPRARAMGKASTVLTHFNSSTATAPPAVCAHLYEDVMSKSTITLVTTISQRGEEKAVNSREGVWLPKAKSAGGAGMRAQPVDGSIRGGSGVLGQGGRWPVVAAVPQAMSASGSGGRERPACCMLTQARRTATLTADDGGGRVQCKGGCHGVVACLAHDAFRGGRHGIVHFQLDVRNAVPARWDWIAPGEMSGHPTALGLPVSLRTDGTAAHSNRGGMLPAANLRKASCAQGVHNLQACGGGCMLLAIQCKHSRHPETAALEGHRCACAMHTASPRTLCLRCRRKGCPRQCRTRCRPPLRGGKASRPCHAPSMLITMQRGSDTENVTTATGHPFHAEAR